MRQICVPVVNIPKHFFNRFKLLLSLLFTTVKPVYQGWEIIEFGEL